MLVSGNMRKPSDILEPSPGGLAERVGKRFRTHHPISVGIGIVFAGYLVMAAILMALGLLVTKTLAGGPVSNWDDSVNRWFVTQRTTSLTSASGAATSLGATMTVVAIAVVVAIVLAIGRHWRQIGFLLAGLSVEASVALTTSIWINRPRPTVAKIGGSPSTTSFPSGHTAAAVVLYVSLAIILASFVRIPAIRALAWILAIAIPSLVGISRLYRGVHHPTDVIGSIVLGTGALMFGLLAARTAGAVVDRRTDAAKTAPSSPLDAEVSP
jgi:membrane-associated phospholipid phosphatase